MKISKSSFIYRIPGEFYWREGEDAREFEDGCDLFLSWIGVLAWTAVMLVLILALAFITVMPAMAVLHFVYGYEYGVGLYLASIGATAGIVGGCFAAFFGLRALCRRVEFV